MWVTYVLPVSDTRFGTHVSKQNLITLVFLHRLQLEKQRSNCAFHNFCRARCDWDNLANGIFPCHKSQGVFTGGIECMHVVLNITNRSIFIFLCLWVHGCAFVCFLYESVINVIYRPGGPYWVRLCPRSRAPVLYTECTVFSNTDRPMLVNNGFFSNIQRDIFQKNSNELVLLLLKDTPWTEHFWASKWLLEQAEVMQIKERLHRSIFICVTKKVI